MCNGHSFNWVIRGKLCELFPHINNIIRSYYLRQKYAKVCHKQLCMRSADVKLVFKYQRVKLILQLKFYICENLDGLCKTTMLLVSSAY